MQYETPALCGCDDSSFLSIKKIGTRGGSKKADEQRMERLRPAAGEAAPVGTHLLVLQRGLHDDGRHRQQLLFVLSLLLFQQFPPSMLLPL